MRYFLFISIIIFWHCSQQTTAVKTTTPSPNFLILIADDLGWKDVGCYGNKKIATPNIDRLAVEGVLFENAFLTVPQCSPSRISILSGKYPHATGAEDLHIPMPDSLNILPHYLQQKNYFSGLLKKSHLGPYGDDQFQFLHSDLDQFATFLTAANERPFFCWVGFSDPHRPYEANIIDQPKSSANVDVPPYLVDNAATRADLADYYNEIRRMDAQIGQYLALLEERDQLGNTVIIFLSDNGAPFPRAKGTLYDAGIKTPLIVRGPTIPSAERRRQLISSVDIAPTILEMLGLAIPANMQGQSFLPLLFDDHATIRSQIFAERNWHNTDEHQRAIRTERFKLIENSYVDSIAGVASDIGESPSWRALLKRQQNNTLSSAQRLIFQQPRPIYELYDLANDPEEFTNLAAHPDFAEQKKQLINRLGQWKRRTHDFSPDQRRRPDNVNRHTGEKFWFVKVPPFEEFMEFNTPPTIWLTETERTRLRQDTNPKDAFIKARLIDAANQALWVTPNPIDSIFYQGLVSNNPKRVKSVVHLVDMQRLYDLLWSYILTEKQIYAEKAKAILLAWVQTYQPDGNDVNENKLTDCFYAYEVLQPLLSTSEKQAVADWLSAIAYAQKSRWNLSSGSANRHVKRIRLILQGGIALQDSTLSNFALAKIDTLLANSLRSDGRTQDLERRDALHYHVGSVLNFLKLNYLTRIVGVNLYDKVASSGGSVRKSLAFTYPYIRCEKVYAEWVNTKVRFDRERWEAGDPYYRPGKPWNPKEAYRSLLLAEPFDEAVSPLLAMLRSEDEPLKLDWLALLIRQVE
ncbi:MAG: sulfatase-like hydrolase/transferase [Bacteroidota bacterium]